MLAPLLAALALAGGSHAADLNALFADALPEAKAKTRIAVLLPDALPTDAKQLYAEHWETRRTYTLSLGAVPDCGEATACFEAEFRGEKGGTPFGSKRVALARGRHGRFKPLSCGASCSPPAISWRERGATYTIQANVVGRGSDRAMLTRMANEAIRRGPR
jgi:hypothetical protein